MRNKYRLFIHIILWSYLFLIPLNCEASEKQCVILLHGLARSHYAMTKLESTLKLHHFIVVNEDYPTTQKSIEALANQSIPSMINECLKYHPARIDFVTHSLGGIVLQEYLQNHKMSTRTRIVMLGPPNHGSQLADLLHNNWIFKIIRGPAGQELTTDKNSVPNKLHLAQRYQLGVIAGNYSLVPFGNLIFHEANDGKVSVTSARTKEMKDFILLPVSHTFMMNNALVEDQILYFLNHGKFIHTLTKN
ncbi:MAG: alpha/beta hydrolase [Gammaproteobacteria bacterium]|nr:alpha/beta hydrolase [Gammaproteobacteria bacterium]